MSTKSKKAKTSAKGGVKKGKTTRHHQRIHHLILNTSQLEESGEVRSTERDGEDRSSDVESATIAPETSLE